MTARPCTVVVPADAVHRIRRSGLGGKGCGDSYSTLAMLEAAGQPNLRPSGARAHWQPCRPRWS